MTKISGPLPAGAVAPPTSWQQFRRDPVVSSARWIYSHRPPPHSRRVRNTKSKDRMIRLVCISDTHNTQPSVPDGDVLIHAGDLSNNGTFAELQAQLTWLGSLPHRHKIVVAGNHDRLLDPAFVEQHPERIRETPGAAMSDLNWHDLVYLQDSSTTTVIANDRTEDDQPVGALSSSSTNHGDGHAAATLAPPRTLKIYGSPQTPLCGTFAFQYPPIRNVWRDRIPADANIVVVHGPPRGFLDRPLDGQGQLMNNKGCPHLVRELMRVQPQLVVFGHIHSGHGREVVRWRRRWLEGGYAKVMSVAEGERLSAWVGGLLVFGMLMGLAMAWFASVLGMGGSEGERSSKGMTLLVNAAIGEDAVEHSRCPVIIEI